MKSMKCRFTLVLCLLAASSAGMGPVSAEPPKFSMVAPGIAHAIFEVRPADAAPFSGHAFKIDLDVAESGSRWRTLGAAHRRADSCALSRCCCCNASFFDKEGRAMGLAVDEGRVMALGKQRSWGALVIDGTNGRIMLGADIQDHLAHRLVVQGIPRLLVGGKVQQLKPQIGERTAVCAEGNVVVLVVSTKAEATAFARFLGDPPDRGGLGCWDALNLDGLSTQLVVKLPTLALSLPGGWGVPNALVVAPGKR
jgi:uncharacterized protein YigE (DUF2233 family)